MKSRCIALIARSLSVVAVALPVTTTASPTALAAVPTNIGCWGDYCSGKDPQATNCDSDARTLASARIPGTLSYVELRWSPTCQTNWARVPASWGLSYPGALKAVQRQTGYTQRGVVNFNADFAWTRMIYSPVKCVYAAWDATYGGPGSTGTWCV